MVVGLVACFNTVSKFRLAGFAEFVGFAGIAGFAGFAGIAGVDGTRVVEARVKLLGPKFPMIPRMPADTLLGENSNLICIYDS